MSLTTELDANVSHALIQASPDLTFIIRGDSIELLTVGENSWLSAQKFSQLTLNELFDEDLLVSVQGAIDQLKHLAKASEADSPSSSVKVELLIAPDRPQIWGYLGLTQAQIYELGLTRIDDHRVLASMRNTTELSRLQQAHLRAVMRDPLTGLRSQRALVTVLEKAFGEAQRFDNMRFALVILDIDRFSAINQQYGWDAGDLVLKAVAQQLSATQRSSDFVCRFGDDLFALLLSEADLGDAVGTSQRLQNLVSEISFDFATDPLNLTLSAGASAYVPEQTESISQLITQAQKNLLLAKSRGAAQIIAQ